MKYIIFLIIFFLQIPVIFTQEKEKSDSTLYKVTLRNESIILCKQVIKKGDTIYLVLDNINSIKILPENFVTAERLFFEKDGTPIKDITVHFGFRIEQNFYNDRQNGKIQWLKYSDFIDAFYLVLMFSSKDYYSTECRLGIIQLDTHEPYTGIDLNLLYHRYFNEHLNLFAIFNFHVNAGSSYGMSYSTHTESKIHYQLGVGFGLLNPMKSPISFDFSVLRELSTDYGTDYNYFQNVRYSKSLYWIIKTGINIIF